MVGSFLPQVINEHGFLKGLYTDIELRSEHVKDKDAKVAFLQKWIDATSTFHRRCHVIKAINIRINFGFNSVVTPTFFLTKFKAVLSFSFFLPLFNLFHCSLERFLVMMTLIYIIFNLEKKKRWQTLRSLPAERKWRCLDSKY